MKTKEKPMMTLVTTKLRFQDIELGSCYPCGPTCHPCNPCCPEEADGSCYPDDDQCYPKCAPCSPCSPCEPDEK